MNPINKGAILALIWGGTLACAQPSVMRSRNVTSPVSYGPVNRLGEGPGKLPGLRRSFSARVRSSASASTREENGFQITESARRYEGSNKFDAKILAAQGSCHKCRIHIERVPVGAYHSFVVYGMLEKNWVGLEGGIHDTK